MAQERGYFSKHLTSPLPWEVDARETDIRETRLAAQRAADFFTTVSSSTGASQTTVDGARADLQAACTAVADAERPLNVPINVCFSPDGCNIANLAIDILMEATPDKIKDKDDIENMYNNVDKNEIFDTLDELRPDLTPCYVWYYWEPAVIRLNRTKGQLVVEVTEEEHDAHIGEGEFTPAHSHMCENIYYSEGSEQGRRLMRKCFSHIGTHQGSCIATAGAILPYHNKLRQLCREFRDATVLCDADDTVADVPKLELDRFLERKASLQGQCGLTSNRGKNAAHAPDGDYTGLCQTTFPSPPTGLRCSGLSTGRSTGAPAC